ADNVAEDQPEEDDDAAASNVRAFAERFAPNVAGTKTHRMTPRSRSLEATVARVRKPAGFRRPSLNLLRRSAGGRGTDLVDVAAGTRTLQDVLAAFGINGQITDAHPGPVVTRYELEPARGTKTARVIGLADDFARELGVQGLRVSVMPGRTTIGIE